MNIKFKLSSFYIIFLSCLFLTWNIVSYLINFVSTEGLISSLRIFISTIIVLSFYSIFSLKGILKLLFFIGLFNSLLVVLQVYDSIFSEILPEYLKYGYFYTNAEFVDSFRMGGLMISLQVSSFLSLISIFISYKYFSKFNFILFPILSFPIIFGSRTILTIYIFVLIINFFKYRFSFLLNVFVFYIILNIPTFAPFVKLRLEPLVEIFFNGDLDSDYSLADTKTHYNFDLLDFKTLLIGNGFERYSIKGGMDPFYTRWLFQTGFIGLLLVLSILIYIIYISRLKLSAKLFILFIILLTSFKNELITSAFVFPFFLFYMLKVNKDEG